METRSTPVPSLWVLALLGLVLLVGPWTAAWTVAACDVLPRWIAGWVLTGWCRGLVSGIGAIDVLVAFSSGARVWQDRAKKRAASMMPPAERVPRTAQGEERRGE